MQQFSSASIIVFEQYAIGCHSPLGCFQEKTLAIAPSKALVSSIEGRFRLKQASRGADTSRSLSLLKAYLYIALKQKDWSFLIRRLRGRAILLQFLIKRRQKLQNPKNNCTPFTVRGGIYQVIAAVFSRSVSIPSVLIINPKYFIRLTLNSDFLILAQRPALRSRYRTFQTCFSYFSSFLEQIIILSRQAVQKSLRQLKSILFIYYWYIVGLLVSLKGSTLYLYNPY